MDVVLLASKAPNAPDWWWDHRFGIEGKTKVSSTVEEMVESEWDWRMLWAKEMAKRFGGQDGQEK